jgi:hypothetical protein
MKIKHFISNLDMFPLISQMIFYINELTLILKIIGQCDVKHNVEALEKLKGGMKFNEVAATYSEDKARSGVINVEERQL